MTEVKDFIESCLTTKRCSSCSSVLPLSYFSINRQSKDGLQNKCKQCDRAYQATRRKEKRLECLAYGREYQKKRRENFEYRLKMLLNSSKQRAAQKNREHTITLEDIKALYPVDGKCPVFGIVLEFGNAGFRENSPSIDRIDSSKGYTPENIQIISWKANRLKAYATLEDLEALVAFMRQGD